MGNATAVISLGSDYDATRAVALETQVARTDGVDSVEFNYTNNKLTVKFVSDRVSLAELKAVVIREKKHSSRSVTG
jgi:copper chaperone CopZ